jgi:sialidase-1
VTDKYDEKIGACVWKTSEENPRNGEADAIQLADGRLFLAYTYFYGGGHDESAAEIRGCYSEDGGRTWSDEHVIQENIGLCNVMCVNLLELDDGRIAFVFAVKSGQVPGEFDCRPFIKYSTDSCLTWSEPTAMSPDANRYYVLENSRLIQLSNGRILFPIALLIATNPWWFAGCCVYSDDSGESWKVGEFAAARDYPIAGFVENGVVEIDTSRRTVRGASRQNTVEPVVLMYARSSRGEILHCFSVNGGITWSEPEPLGPKSPISPSMVKRIPSTGDLLLIWNAVDRRTAHPQWRSPLTAAISKDEGQTWINMRDIEPNIETTYCYPSLTFTREDTVVLTYYRGEHIDGGQHNLREMVVRVLPVSWFY